MSSAARFLHRRCGDRWHSGTGYVHALDDLLLARLGLADSSCCLHDLRTGSNRTAAPASIQPLHGMSGGRMQTFDVVSSAFDLAYGDAAGTDRLTVDVHRTGAAYADAAPVLGSGELRSSG
jgi:hypothetical protein